MSGILPSLYCGGYQPPQTSLFYDYFMGPFDERVCIYLAKPNRHPYNIESYEDVNVNSWMDSDPETTSTYFRDVYPLRVAGTKKNKTKVYARFAVNLPPRVTPYSSIGYTKKPCILAKRTGNPSSDEYCTKTYIATVMELSEVLESEDNVVGKMEQSARVWCVFQQKKRKDYLPRFHHDNDRRKFLPFCHSAEEYKAGCYRLGLYWTPDIPALNPAKDLISDLIRNHLPIDIHMDVLKNLRYDQVSWLADSNCQFLRLLASHRYNIKWNGQPCVLRTIRQKAAREMVFRQKEDMWVVSLNRAHKKYGQARRFTVEEGVYSWHLATSVTNMRLDSGRSKCSECIEKLIDLQTKMEMNQEAMMFGTSSLKVFVLQGAEGYSIDRDYASPLFQEGTEYEDYAIHMWVEGLDNKWMIDLRCRREDDLEYEQYRKFESFNTMIFKDPVKFFRVKKVVVWIDNGILALTSEKDGEVLGYVIEDEEYRFRLAHARVIGVNFLPPTLYQETVSMSELALHFYQHDVEEELKSVRDRITSLMNNVVDDRQHIQAQLNIAYVERTRLLRIRLIGNSYELKRTGRVEETLEDSSAHVHESFEGDFDFCTRYISTGLYESSTREVIKRNMAVLFTRCPLERQHPEKICNLNVVNPTRLRSLYAVQLKESLDINFST